MADRNCTSDPYDTTQYYVWGRHDGDDFQLRGHHGPKPAQRHITLR